MIQGFRPHSVIGSLSRLSTTQPSRVSVVAFASLIGFLLLLIGYHNSSTYVTTWSSAVSASASDRGTISPARQKSLDAIQNTTLGFEKILAINLPERTDYRDGLTLAGAVSNIKVEFIDGVHGDTVLDKVIPPKHVDNPEAALRGSWRAHVNALRSVVEHNWTTALIFEADVDWDVRVRDVLTNVALGSEALLSLSARGVEDQRFQLSRLPVPAAEAPPVSPYGDGWDLLWLGHCGMQIQGGSNVVVIEDEDTVPEAQFVRTWDSTERSPLEEYPAHSRIVFHTDDCVCSIGYAVTQSGARQLLNSLGLHRLNAPVDIMLREWCGGREGDDPHVCVGTLPTVFASHRPAGSTAGDSDMGTPADGFRDRGFTQNIRWSVRMNMDKIVRGETDYEDQFPDTVNELVD
ncbi:hypothetical protein G647_04753 [Cladophialophora carrionii CBS 160.54]|uniref:Glycosyltransferase family 25 protein n=1 Tax=Cladophialophora carrionii CBS 160.54 TaxID=1279043 RepID=V9D9J0_9EURO|nr:uncharacterized protein G647_04753 [Cladophialophora carrionii CBS 160.54]ETI22958.1 hypothetical protein G647_04753 [Cladophialophora carrionii CBS 160.54]